jgi:pilus assembly protein Flp/PilA
VTGHPRGCACSLETLSSQGCNGMELVNRFIREEDGQDVVEYGLLIATIAIVVLIGVGIFGQNINAWFKNLAGRITTVGT